MNSSRCICLRGKKREKSRKRFWILSPVFGDSRPGVASSYEDLLPRPLPPRPNQFSTLALLPKKRCKLFLLQFPPSFSNQVEIGDNQPYIWTTEISTGRTGRKTPVSRKFPVPPRQRWFQPFRQSSTYKLGDNNISGFPCLHVCVITRSRKHLSSFVPRA